MPDVSAAGRPSADLAFEALADPTRRQILAVLAETDECSAGELAERVTTVGRTAVSGHLRILRIAGLVTERRCGRYRFYAIDPRGAAADVIALLRTLFRSSLNEARSAVENHAMTDMHATVQEAAG